MVRTFFQNIQKKLKENLSKLVLPLLIVLFVAVYLFNLIIYLIKPGEAGVLWKMFGGGTQIDYVYPEGIQIIFPWDKMYLYNIRIQQTAHEFDVLTKDGLSIHLSISIRYYPERRLLGVLHQKVGPDYVNTVVIPEIESVLRVLIGRMRAEEVYTTERAIIEQSVNSAVEQIAQRYINVDNVIIKRVIFPSFIVDAIEKKMEQQQIAQAYEFKLERERKEMERKEIEAKGIKIYHEIVGASLSDPLLRWRAIQATVDLASSANAKVVVIGSGASGLPIIGNIPLEPTFANASSIKVNLEQTPGEVHAAPVEAVKTEKPAETTKTGKPAEAVKNEIPAEADTREKPAEAGKSELPATPEKSDRSNAEKPENANAEK